MLCLQDIIDTHYPPGSEMRDILLTHSRSVARKALELAARHPELHINHVFLARAAMVHDIGIFRTNAPGIKCFGTEPYICHGILGAEIMRQAGYENYARVCERHTGTGLSLHDILSQQLPLPHADFQPQTVAEQLICFADKFFSKTHLDREKTLEQARQSLQKFGPEAVKRFDHWCQMFL